LPTDASHASDVTAIPEASDAISDTPPAVDSGSTSTAADSSGDFDSPAQTAPLLLIAAGGEGTNQVTTGYSYDVGSDTWSAGTPLDDGTSGTITSTGGAIALAFVGANSALAVLTDPTDATDTTGASGPVQFAT
jgi:hypothetical protein